MAQAYQAAEHVIRDGLRALDLHQPTAQSCGLFLRLVEFVPQLRAGFANG